VQLVRLQGHFGQGCPQLDQLHPGEAVDLDGVAAVAEHAEHLAVLGQHLGVQDLDAELVGGLGELTEQRRAQPLALHGVGDLEGDLGPLRVVRFTLHAGMADHLTMATDGRHEPEAAVVVDLGGPSGGPCQVGEGGEEAQPPASIRQPPQQQPHRRRVSWLGRAHVDGRAVPEHYVEFSIAPVDGHGQPPRHPPPHCEQPSQVRSPAGPAKGPVGMGPLGPCPGLPLR
jgi:hypothetical protein